MIKIAIYGKGGIGKSTTTANISAAMSDMGCRVMQIGCDPKSDSTKCLMSGKKIPTVLDTIRDKGDDGLELEDIVFEGYKGTLCVEAGGPTPGIGCAGFGASLAILLSAGNISIQLTALVFGLGVVGIVLAISRVRKKTELFMLVLSGVIVAAFFEALISFVKYIADPQDKLPAITVWLMGTLASASYRKLLIATLTILPCIFILIVLRWKMNLLSLSEEEAQSLGVNVDRLRVVIILTSTLMTAVSVSLCGIIGWIGLVIPHIGRFFIGHDHRGLVPSCVLLGGTYMLLIDGIARSLTAAELPLSILTAIIGAPFFAFMLRRTMGGGKSS